MYAVLALSFPDIDPVAFAVGPLAVRWYSLAYMAGILGGWWVVGRLNQRSPLAGLTSKHLDDLVVWAVGGVILGGRLGYVLFYNPSHYLEHPWDIPKLWHGGMSFHGGALGVIVAFWLFARRYRLPYRALMDRVCCAVPIGLFFGRIANFINGELYGRVTDVPWGMVFPEGGPLPRHPSQLYEAFLEGALLFAVLLWFYWRGSGHRPYSLLSKPGALSGVFLFGYGAARFAVELVREPDQQLGFLAASLTMGQLLCLPMMAVGLWLILRRDEKTSL